MTASTNAPGQGVVERSAPGDHWKPETPAVERAMYAAAWQAYQSCRDCRSWGDNDEADGSDPRWKVACCGLPANRTPCASFMTPEDFTCDGFEAARNRPSGVPVAMGGDHA